MVSSKQCILSPRVISLPTTVLWAFRNGSPTTVKDPSKVKHASRLEQKLCSIVHISRSHQGLYSPCATHTLKKAMAMKNIRGHDPLICLVARHTSTALPIPTTQWYRQRLRAVYLTSSTQIMPWVRQLEST